jgi:YfiH family protein
MINNKPMPLIFAQFEKYPELQYGFSGKQDGSMNRRLEKENRSAYFRKKAIDPARVVTADLIHGARAERVGNEAAGIYVPESDALVTGARNLFLSATGADCFIIYFYDPEKGLIGITHAGWRGTLAGVVKNTVQALVENFGTAPKDLRVGISPGIRKCHFEISPGDKIKYQDYPSFILERDGKVFVDLAGIIRGQLVEKGVLEKNIEDSGICTYCNERDFFSYRRDKPKEVQAMVAYIGLT